MAEGIHTVTTKAQVAQIIIAEAKARGHTRNDCLAEMSALYQESGWDETVWDSTHVTYGVAQQDGSYVHRFDGAAAQVKAFFDKLDVWRHKPGASSDIWLNICWMQQAPNWESAQYWYDHGRRAYLTEIKSRIATVTPYLDKYWPTTGGTSTVPDNRPDFNEINEIDLDKNADGSFNHASVRSRLPMNFFLHTQEGNGNATDLSAFLRSTSGTGAVSYHYTIHEDLNDHGVTLVDVVDTDLYSWSVLSANVFSINLCFAGSRAGDSRDDWLRKYSHAIDVAAYVAVQDARKYKFSTEVILPPYGQARQGISDHRYVTKCLGIGTHVDVGGPMGAPWSGFPWDVFLASVKKYDGGAIVTPQPVPVTPPPADPFNVWLKKATDRELLEWNTAQLGPGDPAWPSKGATLRDKVWSLDGKA